MFQRWGATAACLDIEVPGEWCLIFDNLSVDFVHFFHVGCFVYANPLFLIIFILMRGLRCPEGYFSNPSRLPSKTPRFLTLNFCAWARGFGALCSQTIAPVRKT